MISWFKFNEGIMVLALWRIRGFDDYLFFERRLKISKYVDSVSQNGCFTFFTASSHKNGKQFGNLGDLCHEMVPYTGGVLL